MQEKAPQLTEIEYLDLERSAEIKHEYFDGEIFAMTGASEPHNLITANVIRELGNGLKNTACRVYASDMRLKVSETGLFTYPDVMVVCGEREFVDARSDTLQNPDLIVEVLSDSTESYDRGKKFEHYRRLSSLEEYILISCHRRKIEKYYRTQYRKWIYSETESESETILLESVPCELRLWEVYHKVAFP